MYNFYWIRTFVFCFPPLVVQQSGTWNTLDAFLFLSSLKLQSAWLIVESYFLLFHLLSAKRLSSKRWIVPYLSSVSRVFVRATIMMACLREKAFVDWRCWHRNTMKRNIEMLYSESIIYCFFLFIFIVHVHLFQTIGTF